APAGEEGPDSNARVDQQTADGAAYDSGLADISAKDILASPGRHTRTDAPMARWEFSLTVDRRQRTAVFVQIVRAIVNDITRGRLRAGDALPGTRTLARTLGVQRQTVVAAF